MEHFELNVIICLTKEPLGLRIAGLSCLDRLIKTLANCGLENISIIGDFKQKLGLTLTGFSDLTIVFEKDLPKNKPALYLRSDLCFLGRSEDIYAGIGRESGISLDRTYAFLSEGATATIDFDLLSGTFTLEPSTNLLSLPFVLVKDMDDVRGIERNLFIRLGKPTDGVISRLINRRISTRISRFFIHAQVHPNHFTLATFMIAVVVPLFLVRGDYLGFAIAGLVFNLNSILDGVDGEIARVKFIQSTLGSWLDTLSDFFGALLFFGFFPIGLARYTGNDLYTTIGLLMFALIVFIFLTLFLFGKYYFGSGMLNNFERLIDSQFSTSPRFVKSIERFKYLGKRDVYAFAFMLFCLVGLPQAVFFLTMLGLVFYIVVIYTTIIKFLLSSPRTIC